MCPLMLDLFLTGASVVEVRFFNVCKSPVISD